MTDQARGAGHTKGPWKVVVYGAGVSLVIHSDAENRVCFMATPGDKSSFKTIKANARLIAAAPDLLAACERALPGVDLRAIQLRSHGNRQGAKTWEETAAILRAAIAKAKGEA